jgi:hypothetical protein
MFVQEFGGGIVKSAPDRVDVFKRQLAMMRPVGKKDEYSLFNRIDPEAGAGKAKVPKSFFG